MAPAWLDSLSEDWESQPGSDASIPGHAPSQNATKNRDAPATKMPISPRAFESRLPRPNSRPKKPQGPSNHNSSGVLSERSANEINWLSPRRAPSKLSQEIKVRDRGRYTSRSMSGSTPGSVVHNTVDHKSSSASPTKHKGQTPEWKRRLVYGEVSYGEQRDLFTSAGTGLESIFKPPAPMSPASPAEPIHEHIEDTSVVQHDETMPSSPPGYQRDSSTVEIHVDDSVQQQEEQNWIEHSRDSDFGQSFGTCSREAGTADQAAMSLPHRDGPRPELRKVSGLSDAGHEEFSPIMLTYRQTSSGTTSFGPAAAMTRPMATAATATATAEPEELRMRLEKLRQDQRILGEHVDGSTAEGISRAGQSTNGDETLDMAQLEGHVNFQRGGRSADGSFRHRMLSSALNDSSDLLPEESLQASTPKQFPTVRIESRGQPAPVSADSPDLLRVPNPSPEKRGEYPGLSAASPLKLFQPYDTFTSQTLMRRLSQIEETIGSASRPTSKEQPEPSVLVEGSHDERKPKAGSFTTQHETTGERPHGWARATVSVRDFGSGRLDGYEFSDEFSYHLSPVRGGKDNQDPEGESVMLPRMPPLDVTHDSSPPDEEDLVVRKMRGKSTSSVSNHSARPITRDSAQGFGENTAPGVLATPQRRDNGSEGKRPRTSPSKDPTPKRRRTLHKSDIAYEEELQPQHALDSVQLSHKQMQSILGKKRKDARHGDAQELADARILAMRQVLRPRTPTPQSHQKQSALPERPPLSQVATWTEPAERTARLPGAPLDSTRKPSIKTEDFINEANKIMAMIRSKAGRASGLTSVEESDAEHAQNAAQDAESSFEESTKEPFSRPPSRECRPLPRMSTKQENPELLERLQKYAEPSDMGDMIGSSVRSLALGQEAIRVAAHVEESVAPGGTNTMSTSAGTSASRPSIWDVDEVSDPPNIRIISQRTTEVEPDDRFASNGSTGSSSHSTARSIPTGSSRGSETRRTIAPQSVLHLIPDRVGDMVLDKDRQIWIRKKSEGNKKHRSSFVPSEDSEDDPFADIPDLSVDATIEFRNLHGRGRGAQAMAMELHQELPDRQTDIHSPSSIRLSPGRKSQLFSAASAQKASSPLQSPGPGKAPTPSPAAANEEEDEEVEHEIRLHEDRVRTPKRRNLTISFSSPIASIIQDAVAEAEDLTTVTEEPTMGEVDQTTEDANRANIARGRRKVSVKKSTSSSSNSGTVKSTASSRSSSRGPLRRVSVCGQTFVARPVSRIDERDEDNVPPQGHRNGASHAQSMEVSIVADENSLVDAWRENQRSASLGFVVVTPARPQECPMAGVDAAPVISNHVGTYSLSPLSEFTVHHANESLPLEASYLVDEHHLVTGDRSKRVMSMNTRELVDKLAEVEPFEPYWEDMRDLELAERRLNGLHTLEEFCPHLESLDISNNRIRNLSGIPASVRHLKVVCNELSSLTAWSHLMNLQYVDVSNNGLTSLSAFKGLVHLRSLRADNNQLTSLDGIKFHDALQTLRARGNAIEKLDLDGTRLCRLTELDLKDNTISSLANMGQLVALSSLNLEGNRLESFALEPEQPCTPLRYLRLGDNLLSALDVKKAPHLRLLHADRNRLTQISGMSRTRRIDSLSLREQHGEGPLDVAGLLNRAYEVRKLYLSGNLIESFEPSVDLLNLQLLELANCGLRTLPVDLGCMLPNLRVLNLNFNALTGLEALRCVPRLKRIFAAGNRFADSAALINVLARFEHLSVADLRNNPLTHGFYYPVAPSLPLTSPAPHLQPLGGGELLQKPTPAGDMTSVGASSTLADPFSLRDEDPATDRAYASRLDLDTRMRRRLYETVFGAMCSRLRKLDGLPLARGDAAECRDAVWKALAAQGFVVSGDGCEVDSGDGATTLEGTEEEYKAEKGELSGAEESARWEVENSFA